VENYEIYAIKYAEHDRMSGANFIGGDAHEVPMPLDYYVWLIKGANRHWVVDTGFSAQGAAERGRRFLRCPSEGLKLLGVQADSVSDVIITHMHYDHCGNSHLFQGARYHLQDKEMQYATSRCMCHRTMRYPFSLGDVVAMVERLYTDRVVFHDGAEEIAPGISVHHLGGHTAGLQVVRVHTARGWVVLASDASHFYANMEDERPFPVVYNVGDMIEGYHKAYALASSPDHVIPGHDPLVMKKYPAPHNDLQGIVARLDVAPIV
jgi:glyoxylase-like metal-dependent hydrolase (beta-lactamase superfamily II)